MSEFAKLYRAAAELEGKKTISYRGETVRKALCKFCLAEGVLHEASEKVYCRTCGSVFSVSVGKTYYMDKECLGKIPARQVYHAAFFDGRVNLSLTELAAGKGDLKAILYMARYWEQKRNMEKAQVYYKRAAEIGDEGKAANILYRFRQEPPFFRYPALIDELKACVGEYTSKNFYYVDPNECDEVIAYREQCYKNHLKEEQAKQERLIAQMGSARQSYGSGGRQSGSSEIYASDYIIRCLREDLGLCCSQEEKEKVLNLYKSRYSERTFPDVDTTYTPPIFDEHDYLATLNEIM